MIDVNAPQKLSLANKTPLQLLPRLSKVLGGPKIWVKRDDLTENGAGGNKIRKLEFVLAEAQTQKADVLITCGGIQSNHCRATALLGARLGFKTHLILRGQEPKAPQANTFIDVLAGAALSFHSLDEYKRLPQLFTYWQDYYAKQGLKAYVIPTGASDEVGLWGYIVGAWELLEQINALKLSNVHVVCATGSGGTHAGLALGMHIKNGAPVTGIAVCDDAQAFIDKAQLDYQRWEQRYSYPGLTQVIEVKVDDRFIGPGYAKTYPELLKAITMAARCEGLLLDPVYTGKAFYGLIQAIKNGELAQFDHVIFVHTGGVFGLFPYTNQLI